MRKNKSQQSDNHYTPIWEAVNKKMNHEVNLMGVVLATTIPIKSSGTDFFSLVKIVDPMYDKDGGLTVNIFTKALDDQPLLLNAGDIIKLSKVKMQIHKSSVFALFDKWSSSFALFEGKYSTSFVPYQVYALSKFNTEQARVAALKRYDVTKEDKRFISGLRWWLTSDDPTARVWRDVQSLKDIREGDKFNLVCKILHVWDVREDEWMLLVWDGTDTPPVAINSRLADEEESPLPLQSLPVCLPRVVIYDLPPIGTVLRVTQNCGNKKLAMNMLKTNRWVKFDNIQCELHASLWSASLLPCTRFCYLRDEDDMVLQRMRDYDERYSSNWMPLSSFPWPSRVTETDHCDKTFVTLMRVLAHDKVVGKFCCVVRVVATYPDKVEEYFSTGEGAYRIRLTLEDPTARIHAHLYKEDAEKFFGGRCPSLDALKRERNLLLGISESDGDSEVDKTSRNPPWIMCCLKSYCIDGNNKWGTRNFRIFDTTLRGLSSNIDI